MEDFPEVGPDIALQFGNYVVEGEVGEGDMGGALLVSEKGIPDTKLAMKMPKTGFSGHNFDIEMDLHEVLYNDPRSAKHVPALVGMDRSFIAPAIVMEYLSLDRWFCLLQHGIRGNRRRGPEVTVGEVRKAMGRSGANEIIQLGDGGEITARINKLLRRFPGGEIGRRDYISILEALLDIRLVAHEKGFVLPMRADWCFNIYVASDSDDGPLEVKVLDFGNCVHFPHGYLGEFMYFLNVLRSLFEITRRDERTGLSLACLSKIREFTLRIIQRAIPFPGREGERADIEKGNSIGDFCHDAAADFFSECFAEYEGCSALAQEMEGVLREYLSALADGQEESFCRRMEDRISSIQRIEQVGGENQQTLSNYRREKYDVPEKKLPVPEETVDLGSQFNIPPNIKTLLPWKYKSVELDIRNTEIARQIAGLFRALVFVFGISGGLQALDLFYRKDGFIYFDTRCKKFRLGDELAHRLRQFREASKIGFLSNPDLINPDVTSDYIVFGKKANTGPSAISFCAKEGACLQLWERFIAGIPATAKNDLRLLRTFLLTSDSDKLISEAIDLDLRRTPAFCPPVHQ